MTDKRTPNIGPCVVEGCDRPMRKREWCGSHYAQWYRHGEIRPQQYRWASEPNCVICGAPNGGFRSRKVCSAACKQILHRHGGAPADPKCVRCGDSIPLTRGRRRVRADVKLCKPCKAQTRTEATPLELARRDGAFCQICGCDVDTGAVGPDPMRPSVDHILPRARGGSDAAENCQLSHLLCNQIKSDRVGFSLKVGASHGC